MHRILKKTLTLFTGIIIGLSTIPLSMVNASAEYETSGYLTYSVSGNEVAIQGCTAGTEEIIIPEKIGGLSVTSIASYAFMYNRDIKNITMPDSLEEIGDDAFWNCGGLTSINIPVKVSSIGREAFGMCDTLKNFSVDDDNPYYTDINGILFNHEVTQLISYPSGKTAETYTIPETVTELCIAAFSGCRFLTSVNFPDNLNIIRMEAFRECDGLTDVTIPDSVTEICHWAFNSCDQLASIKLGKGLERISSPAFAGCTSLTDISIDPSNKYFKTIDGAMFDYDMTTLIQYPIGKTDAEYAVPNGIEIICDSAFESSWNLTNVTIPNSVTYIGASAFYGCYQITDINIPDSVTEIDQYVFNGTGIYENSPDGIVYADEWAVGYKGYDIPAGTKLIFKDTTKGISNSAFCFKSGITSTVIPDSVNHIGSYAFQGCSDLTSVSIGTGVVSIKARVFDDTPFLNNQPDGIINIAGWVIGCKGEFPYTEFIFDDTVKGIADYAFIDYDNLVSVTIDDSVIYIGEGAFTWEIKNISGYTGSAAEAYANELLCTFIPLDDKVYETGDPTGDGMTTIADVILVQKAVTGASILSKSQVAAADLCKNGKLDVFDIILIKKLLLYISTEV